MTTNTGTTQFSGSSQRGFTKSIPTTAAIAALPNPARAKAAPAYEDIVLRAYEIWLSTGKESGRDQEHWFQAERELGAR